MIPCVMEIQGCASGAHFRGKFAVSEVLACESGFTSCEYAFCIGQTVLTTTARLSLHPGHAVEATPVKG